MGNIESIKQFLPLAQLTVAAILIAFVLIQQRGTALGSAFGQSGGAYSTRRGIQKKIFWATIVLGIIFLFLAVLNLALS